MKKFVVIGAIAALAGLCYGATWERTYPQLGHTQDWSDRASIISMKYWGLAVSDPYFYKDLVIDPYKEVKEGEEQYFSVWVADSDPEGEIETVTVSIETDKGRIVFDLELVEGTKKDGRWMGSWTVKNISSQAYYFTQVCYRTNRGQMQARNLFLCPSLQMLPLNPEWMYFGQENSSLPSPTISSLIVDPEQNIWIGTWESGLAKFDGVNFIVYNTDNSELPNNAVRALAVDTKGNIWIATPEGLAKFDGENWTIYTPENSGVPLAINAIAIDAQDNLWLGIPRCGIDDREFLKFNGVNCEIIENRVLVSNIVRSIVIDSSGNKWIGQNNGMSGGLSVYRQGGVILPVMVTLLSPSDNSYLNDDIVNFIWNANKPGSVDHYILHYALNSGFSQGLVETTSVDTTFTTTLADTTYYWRVKAVDRAENQSDWSSVWYFEIDTHSPGTPALISPPDSSWLNDNAIAFEWSEVAKGTVGSKQCGVGSNVGQGLSLASSEHNTGSKSSPIHYILQVDTTLNFNTPITDTTNVTYDTLTLDEYLYYWRVRAYDEAGNEGEFSQVSCFVVDTTTRYNRRRNG